MFTGQRKEPGTDALGLYDYGARFYSTATGRFLGVDPAAGSESDPQSWNAYMYVRGNPMRFVDPTGMKSDSQIEAEEEEYKNKKDRHYQEAEAEDWASAPAMQEYQPCVECLVVMMAAALAYQEAAATQAWVTTAPATNPSSYGQPAAVAEQSGGDELGDKIGQTTFVVGSTIVIGETIDPLPLDPGAWLIGGGVIATGAGIGWALNHFTQGSSSAPRPVVIGEDQAGRVIPAAMALGADYYTPPELPLGMSRSQTKEWSIAQNRKWINQMMDEGRTIYDIGPAPGRENYPNPTSDWYRAELEEIDKRGYANCVCPIN